MDVLSELESGLEDTFAKPCKCWQIYKKYLSCITNNSAVQVTVYGGNMQRSLNTEVSFINMPENREIVPKVELWEQGS